MTCDDEDVAKCFGLEIARLLLDSSFREFEIARHESEQRMMKQSRRPDGDKPVPLRHLSTNAPDAPRGHQSHDTAQRSQEREKNGPVRLLVSNRMNSEKETKNGGHRVYVDRDDPGNILERGSFAHSKRARHRDLLYALRRFRPVFVAVRCL